MCSRHDFVPARECFFWQGTTEGVYETEVLQDIDRVATRAGALDSAFQETTGEIVCEAANACGAADHGNSPVSITEIPQLIGRVVV